MEIIDKLACYEHDMKKYALFICFSVIIELWETNLAIARNVLWFNMVLQDIDDVPLAHTIIP